MESQVKERIVGAAVLVALGVWLIPWVLDGPEETPPDGFPEGSPHEPALNLPAADEAAPVRTETVELEPREPPARRRDEAAESRGIAVVVPGAAPDADDNAASVASGEASEQAEDAPAAHNADTDAAVAASGESVAGTVPEPPPAPTPASDLWAVQLGAFSESATADQVAVRVSTYGYSAGVSEVRSGDRILHRVRVGGFASENEAEAAASSLSAHGFPVRVIAPE